MFARHYELVVAGAGVAGIAAAVAAARRGLQVALVEKTVITGGLATAGIVNIYLPLCDGNGTQVSFGLTEELLRNSCKYGPGGIPADWQTAPGKRFSTAFSPASFTMALDEMLETAGVDLWLDTVVCGAETENGRIAAIEVVNKSGKGKLQADCFIDATGDADLAYYAGAALHSEANALACWTVEYQQGRSGLGENCGVRPYGANTDRNTIAPGISGKIVTDSILQGRKEYRQMLQAEYAAGKSGRSTRFPLMFPSMPELRHTRAFQCAFMLDTGMEWTRFEDSIGLAADWRRSGSVWEIPYRTLLCPQISGLLAAGRCTGSKNDAWEVTRVIPAAAETGEAAGVAAALSAARGITPDKLPYAELAQELRDKCGFPLHFADLGLSRPEKSDSAPLAQEGLSAD